MVMAQAGSDGGSIGRQNRSVTGSQDASPSRTIHRQGHRTKTKKRYRAKKGSGAASTTGSVRVKGNCVYGSYAGYRGRVCY
jgi:hypothetical protein